MAIMIPSEPKKHNPDSAEGAIFNILAGLPDDYYVFHSFETVSKTRKPGIIEEHEADFVILHPKQGILCIEAKNGKVGKRGRNWYYSFEIEGKERLMKHDGPFKQAKDRMHDLIEIIGELGFKRRCKVSYAVWFPALSQKDLEKIEFGEECKDLVITSEAVNDIENAIKRVYAINTNVDTQTNLEENDIKLLLDKVFCPQLDIIPTTSFYNDVKKNMFLQLLKEQSNLLNCLEDQPSAIISGAAGTGKTLIAVEKARRHALNGEKVLFLCFNTFLAEYLTQNCAIENVKYYTIASFACAHCNRECNFEDENEVKALYAQLKEKLEKNYWEEVFPYSHVIIDEGQDFGFRNIEDAQIIELLSRIILDYKKGTFYIFYDKNQLVQGGAISKYIQEADCKLPLYKNCRNSENVAKTSISLFKEFEKINSSLKPGVRGGKSYLFIEDFEEKKKECLEKILEECLASGMDDVVILTCKTENTSVFKPYLKRNVYNFKGQNFKFTTCRKFKGLEADTVILVDVDKDTIENEKIEDKNVFYVGASRARSDLFVIANLEEQDCQYLCQKYDKSSKNIKKSVADILNSRLKAI